MLAGCGGSEVEVIQPTGAVSGKQLNVSADGNWPWWQGYSRSNHAEGTLPTTWSETENIAWATEIPGSGLGSPIVYNGRVYLPTADDAQETQSLVCLSQETGDVVWSKVVHEGNFDRKNIKNSHASSTPACDGKQIFTVFLNQGAVWVTAVTLDGEIKWQKKAGDFTSKHGYGSAAVLYGPLIIVQGDNSGGGWLAGLDRETGEVIWRVRRKNVASFGTPNIIQTGDGDDAKDQLILGGQDDVISYDPLSGSENWKRIGPSSTTANTPAAGGGLFITSGGYPQGNIFAYKSDGSGLVWQVRKKVYVPSPLVVTGQPDMADVVYAVTDMGILYCLDLHTGAELWKERLSGDFSSSPVYCDGKVVLANETGTTFVFEVSDKDYIEVAKNKLPGGILASPVIVDGQIFMRTLTHLYCIGAD